MIITVDSIASYLINNGEHTGLSFIHFRPKNYTEEEEEEGGKKKEEEEERKKSK